MIVITINVFKCFDSFSTLISGPLISEPHVQDTLEFPCILHNINPPLKLVWCHRPSFSSFFLGGGGGEGEGGSGKKNGLVTLASTTCVAHAL